MDKLDSLWPIGPIFLTLFLVLWTLSVSPYSKYGDNWAIYPAMLVLPAALLWHVALIWFQKPRLPLIVYAVIHLVLLFWIWVYCLMKISRDSL